MQHRAPLGFSPYRVFSREDWARLRADTPMTLAPRDLEPVQDLLDWGDELLLRPANRNHVVSVLQPRFFLYRFPSEIPYGSI